MKGLSKKEFFRIYRNIPRVTVDIVLKDRKKGILLIKRGIKPDIGKWHFPGGTVLYKERIMDAVKRKANDETGLRIRIKKFLGVFEYMRWKEPAYGHVIDLVFLAEPTGGKLRGNPRTAGSVLKFFKRVPKDMIPDQKKILRGELIR